MKRTSKRVGVVLFLALVAGPAAFGSIGSASRRPSSLNEGACGTKSTGGRSGANHQVSPGANGQPLRLAVGQPELN